MIVFQVLHSINYCDNLLTAIQGFMINAWNYKRVKSDFFLKVVLYVLQCWMVALAFLLRKETKRIGSVITSRFHFQLKMLKIVAVSIMKEKKSDENKSSPMWHEASGPCQAHNVQPVLQCVTLCLLPCRLTSRKPLPSRTTSVGVDAVVVAVGVVAAAVVAVDVSVFAAANINLGWCIENCF